MSVANTTLQLAALWREIAGIRKAFDTIPRVLLPAQCPAVVIFPGEGTYDKASAGESIVKDDRLFRMVLFYAPASFGTAPQDQTGIVPFIDTVRDFFVGRPGLATATNSTRILGTSDFQGDGGYQIIDYAIGENEVRGFAAVEFRLRVIEWVRVTYYD